MEGETEVVPVQSNSWGLGDRKTPSNQTVRSQRLKLEVTTKERSMSSKGLFRLTGPKLHTKNKFRLRTREIQRFGPSTVDIGL